MDMAGSCLLKIEFCFMETIHEPLQLQITFCSVKKDHEHTHTHKFYTNHYFDEDFNYGNGENFEVIL
jgi:hypothetical protein